MKYCHLLAELIHTVDQNVRRVQQHLEHFTHGNKNVLNIYLAVSDKTYKSDKELFEALKMSRPTFDKYAEQLIDLLTKLMVFIDPEKAKMTAFQKNGIECKRDHGLLDMLSVRNANNTAGYLGKEMLWKAKKYGLPTYAIRALEQKAHTLASVDGNKTELAKTLAALEEWRFFENAERDLLAVYQQMKVHFIKIKGNQPNVQAISGPAIEKFSPLMGQINSFKFNQTFFQVSLLHHQCIGDNAQALDVCEQAIAFYLASEHEMKTQIGLFCIQGAASCVPLKAFERGDAFIENALSTFPEGNSGWFQVFEARTYLCCASLRLEDAFECWKIVTRHRRFSIQRQSTQDIWYLIGGWLKLAEGFGELDLTFEDQNQFDWDTGRFLEADFSFNQDKAALHFSSQLLQLLFWIQKNEWNRVDEKIDALRKYGERHLQEPDAARSLALFGFTTWLAEHRRIAKQPKVDRMARKSVAELAELAPKGHDQNVELEILPFESLVVWVARAERSMKKMRVKKSAPPRKSFSPERQLFDGEPMRQPIFFQTPTRASR